MHKKSRIARLLFSCFFLLSHLLIASSLYQTPIDTSVQPFFIPKPLEEGFVTGTLIKMQDGYELIENIAIGDIVIDANGNPTEVIAITRRFVDKYIQLNLQDTIISAGCDQQLYYSSLSSWVKACNIPCHKKCIFECTFIHALTTISHTLVVAVQDIPAHNMIPIFCGIPTICYGYIAVANPVIAIFGGLSLSLAAVAYSTYQKYVEQQGKDDFHVSPLHDSVILAERFYYEQRKELLNQLKQELMSIKNDLLMIKDLCSSSITHTLLSHHTYDTTSKNQLLSIVQEKNLSDRQKNRLREQRENELTSLEKQIYDLQFLLVLHVNQMIENVEYAQKSYDRHILEIQKAIDFWNNNRERMTIEHACRLYKYNVLREHLVMLMQQTFNELFLITNYYHICTNKCIQSSTTIIPTLEYLASIVAEKRQWILQEAKLTRSNSAIIEEYCAQNDISIMNLRNEAQKEFAAQQKQRDTEVIKNLEIQQQQHVSNGFAGGPNRNDDEDEDEKLKNSSPIVKISEDDAPHMFGNRPGHLIDTPANRQLLIDLTSNKKNFLGVDNYGTQWYAKTIKDGKQLWATVRNHIIRNRGLNNVPKEFNPMTGLSKPARSFK